VGGVRGETPLPLPCWDEVFGTHSRAGLGLFGRREILRIA
jgi:hypothetical protein